MNAMILAAGYGTRLKPLTDRRAKCLMPVMNRPLLGLWLGRMVSFGAERVVINTHHLANQINSWLAKFPSAMMEVLKSHEPEILGTGGGLVKARVMLGEDPFLLVNGDVLCTASLSPLVQTQQETGALAVLGLVDDTAFNTVALDADGEVLGFKGDSGLPTEATWRTYSGLAVISPRLLDLLPPSGPSSLVDGLRAAITGGQGEVIGVELDGYWNDLGSPERLYELHRQLATDPPAELKHLAMPGQILEANGARIHPKAQAEGFAVLGQGALVEEGAYIKDSVLLPGAVITSGAKVSEAILGDGFVARGVIEGGAHA